MSDLQIGIKVQKRFPVQSRFVLHGNQGSPAPLDITG